MGLGKDHHEENLEEGASSSGCCGLTGKGKASSKEEKVKDPSISLYRLLFTFADKKDIALMLLGLVMAAANGATLPLFSILLGGLFDDLNPPGGFAGCETNPNVRCPSEVTGEYASLFGYLAIAAFVASACQVGCFTISSERQAIRIREAYLSAVLKQEISWFDQRKSGELSAKISENTIVIRDALGEKLGALCQFGAMFVVGFLVGFIYSWKLTLVICACAPFLAIGGFMMMKTMADLQSGGLDAYAKAGAVADEAITSIRTVVAFGVQEKIANKYENHLIQAEKFGIKKSTSQGLGMGFTMGVYFACYAIAFYVGAVFIVNDRNSALSEYPPNPSVCQVDTLIPLCGNTTFTTDLEMCSFCPACNCGCLADNADCIQGGDITLVFFAVVMGAFALGQAAPSLTALSNGKISAAKILSTIERKPLVEIDHHKGEKPVIHGEVLFKDVTFSYPTRPEVKVFNKMNLSIEKGKTVALVGGSGCGKSTVVSLLQRFYDPESGSVLIDGKDIRSVNVTHLRNNMGLVGQEPTLFATTIAKNIAYGAVPGHEPSEEEIINAAKAANAYNFITEFPDGFETEVGEKGAQLSGGQKQRIAIARAIIRNAPVLLLDEATSALDNESERIVQAALDKLVEGQKRTTIVIAHRLSTIRKADKIVVLGEGGVLEQGTHEELLQLENGHYNMLSTAANRSQEGQGVDADDVTALIDRLSSANSGSIKEKLSSRREDGPEEVAEENKSQVSDGDDKKKEKEYKVSMSRLFALSKPECLYYLPGFIGAALNGAQMPVFAILFVKIITVFYIPDNEEMKEEAAFYAWLFVGLGLVSFVSNFGQFWAFAYIGEKMTRRVRGLLFRSILRQEISYFDDPKNSTGALTSRLSTDAALVKASLVDRLGLLIMNLVTLVIGLTIAFINGWKLSLVLLVCFPVIAIAGAFQMIAMGGFAKEDDKATGQAAQVLSESVSGIRTVTAFSTRDRVVNLYSEKLIPANKLGIRKGIVGGIGFGISNAVIFAVYGLAFFYGGRLIESGEYDFEQMFLVFFAIIMTAFGAGQAAAMAPDIGKAGAAISNVFTIVDRESKIDATSTDGSVGKENSSGSFTLRNLKFAYPARPDANVFDKFSLEIEGGSTVALVGSSGSGKSTVVSLLERFYDAAEGCIDFDEIRDIRTANVTWLRNQMGLVEQEPRLFATTIKENISFGVKSGGDDATDEEIIQAAKSANAHDFISSFPDGYDTLCGEHGTQLSGGQKQRICIARAIIRKPRILLLDEATAALDNESERIVQEAINKLVENKSLTTLVVAHRLTTIQNADKIVVMDHGVVVEIGKHDELLQKKGAYSKLWYAQREQD